MCIVCHNYIKILPFKLFPQFGARNGTEGVPDGQIASDTHNYGSAPHFGHRRGIKPGSGANKRLAKVGDVSVMGIVAEKSLFNYSLFSSTRLNIVYKMAEIIAERTNGGVYCYNYAVGMRIFNELKSVCKPHPLYKSGFECQ